MNEPAPQAVAPQPVAPQAVAPQPVAPQAVAPQPVAPQAVAPQAVAPQAVAAIAGARLGADLAEATTRASLMIGALADSHLMANYSITYNQYVLIAVLYNHEPTDVTDLAHCLNVSKAAVSKRLPALERDGLIHTQRDPHNLRRLEVTLTHTARGIVEKAGPEMEELLHQLLAHANPAINVAQLAQQMNQLSSILENALGAPQ